MKNLTIGVFDSGLGGLTAMEVLAETLPHADIIYFGDTGHMPYGGRSRSQLLYMARQNIAFLEGHGAQLILAACGTVSSVALDTVARETKTPLFGVATPAAQAAVQLSENKKIGFIATQASVDSGHSANIIAKLCPKATVISAACPKFVPLIEAGVCSPDSPELMAAIDEYLAEIKNAGCDVLILGCTHYPIISAALDTYFGGKIKLISSSGEAANTLLQKLHADGYVPNTEYKGTRRYYTSGDDELFEALFSKLLGHAPQGEIIAIPPYKLIDK